jgi:hypothetical protein
MCPAQPIADKLQILWKTQDRPVLSPVEKIGNIVFHSSQKP